MLVIFQALITVISYYRKVSLLYRVTLTQSLGSTPTRYEPDKGNSGTDNEFQAPNVAVTTKQAQAKQSENSFIMVHGWKALSFIIHE